MRRAFCSAVVDPPAQGDVHAGGSPAKQLAVVDGARHRRHAGTAIPGEPDLQPGVIDRCRPKRPRYSTAVSALADEEAPSSLHWGSAPPCPVGRGATPKKPVESRRRDIQSPETSRHSSAATTVNSLTDVVAGACTSSPDRRHLDRTAGSSKAGAALDDLQSTAGVDDCGMKDVHRGNQGGSLYRQPVAGRR